MMCEPELWTVADGEDSSWTRGAGGSVTSNLSSRSILLQ